jgi:putative redox protein
LRRSIGREENAMSMMTESLGSNAVFVEDSAAGPFAEIVRNGAHVLHADEPVAKGGNDTGPDPYAYLLAALGTCTAMTLRLYARNKQWPLTKVSVQLAHRKIYATDCAECETKEGRIDRLERIIELEGPLSDEQRRRMLEIADHCPVHRTLKSEIVISTQLA